MIPILINIDPQHQECTKHRTYPLAKTKIKHASKRKELKEQGQQ